MAGQPQRIHLVSAYGANENAPSSEVYDFADQLQRENPRDAVLIRPRSSWNKEIEAFGRPLTQPPTEVKLAHYLAWHAIL